MIPAFTLRRLASGDVAVLRRLNALFAEAFDDPAAYGAEPPDDAYLEGLLAKEHVAVLTALTPRGTAG